MRRYKNRTEQFKQNKIFESNTKQFYRKLRKDTTTVKKAITKQDLEQYWRNIFKYKTRHNKIARWLKEMSEEPPPQMTWTNIKTKDFEQAC